MPSKALSFCEAKAYQVPSSAPKKAGILQNHGFFLYDDAELKPPPKKGSPKNPKIFWGRGAATKRLRSYIEDEIPLSGVCCDESPIIRTKKRRTALLFSVFFLQMGLEPNRTTAFRKRFCESFLVGELCERKQGEEFKKTAGVFFFK